MFPALSFCLPGATEIAYASDDQSERGPLTAKVDKLFVEWDNRDSPGAALAIIKDGSVVYKRGYGSANLEYNIGVTPSTVFCAASVSKQFTAFSIATLAEQGKLSLDDDIHKYLPEVPDFGKTITIRHLIHHTSGLRSSLLLLWMAGLPEVVTKEHNLRIVRHQKELNFDPGEEFLYCNTGYTLLAEIVERISGQSLREYTEANIFRPLNMTNTHFHDDYEMIVKNMAYPYLLKKDGSFGKSMFDSANVGPSGLFTTVEDLAKWIQNFEDRRVGDPVVIEQMHQQGVLNNGKELDYAFGLFIGKYKGLGTVSHGGSMLGYKGYILRFPDQRFGVAILSNLRSFNPGGMARQVADIYLADQLRQEESRAERIEMEVDPAIYDAYIGEYRLPISGRIITVTKENDRLISQSRGQAQKDEWFPESEDKFFLKVRDEQMSFQRSEMGKVAQLSIHRNGKDRPVFSAKKVEIVSPTPQQLAEFAGYYHSDELGILYTVSVQDDGLVLQDRHDNISLDPTIADEFVGEWPEGPTFLQIHFSRDEDQKITGFGLTSMRVRNVRFDRWTY